MATIAPDLKVFFYSPKQVDPIWPRSKHAVHLSNIFKTVGWLRADDAKTAKEELGIQDIVTRAEDNIHSGAKYLRYFVEEYLNDPVIAEREKVLLVLAAYNAGLGNLNGSGRKHDRMVMIQMFGSAMSSMARRP
jgi:Transglycosylase SLT domain